MRGVKLFASVFLASFMFSCSDSHQDDVLEGGNGAGKEEINVGINTTGSDEGVNYKLKNVVVNPKLLVLNADNAKLLSAENGVFKIQLLSQDIASNVVVGNILYLQDGEKTYLRLINQVNQLETSVYELDTEEAYLGDLFDGGSIELSVDVDKVEESLNKQRNSSMVLRNAKSYDYNFYSELFNYNEEIQKGGMTYNPNSSLKTSLDIKIAFDKGSRIIPSEFSFLYTATPAFNPYIRFAQSMNGGTNFDLMDNVPEKWMDLLKEMEIDLEIPADILGNIPAKVSISDIKFPNYILANVSNTSGLDYNVNGTLKLGYEFYRNNLSKSGFVYENTLVKDNNPNINLNGEIITDSKVIIVPKISIVDMDLFKVTGDVTFGLETVTNKYTDAKNQLVVGSKGTFNASATFSVSSLGINILTTDLFKETKEMWNFGQLNQEMTFSDLKLTRPSKIICALSSFSYGISLNYKYPIMDKKIPGHLVVTYDVYDDKNKQLKSGETAVFTPSSLTADSFTFELCLPLRTDLLAWTSGLVAKTGSVRNIVITDSYAHKGTVADFAIGSPYNNGFW